MVLILVGAATALAGIYSPWGSTNIFRWTTNFGRDPNLLRLVTPGFGDCLQYIQFIVLTGGLSLKYPGYYQPVVSKVSWSALMFDESLVSNSNGTTSLIDGIYVVRGRYGLDRLAQLVGMYTVDNIWPGMMVWLLCIIAITLVLIQLGFLARWIYRRIMDTLEEDLRAKNMPFSVGNVIRIVFSYFLLPIVALSTFQLLEADQSPNFAVALAAITLVLIVGFTAWLFYFIANARPKAHLFDDLSTVLLYGSLYNTYSDNAAPFAVIPVFLTFVRGIAIGAVQASGIAQLVLLAICEVITILTLHAFRPFHSPTSMNAFHTVFAAFRFGTVLLMISFVESLGVGDGSRDWIGYAILLMHALVLIFGFMLNAIQTMVEVAARMAGAGTDETGAAKGGLVVKVFGMRQLARRLPRRDTGTSRQSHLSSARMLGKDTDQKSYTLDSPRPGSTNLLNRNSSALDSLLSDGVAGNPSAAGMRGSYTPTSPGGEVSPTFQPGTATPATNNSYTPADTADPYYRPPRARRATEGSSPDSRVASWRSGDWTNRKPSAIDGVVPEDAEFFDDATPPEQTLTPPHMVSEGGLPNDNSTAKADFATRESDFYYGVRGPALNSHVPSRRIKTGPVDPNGIQNSALGWVKGFFGNKTKEKGKGFEVVRSARMPPGMMAAMPPEPPDGVPVATDRVRNGPIDSDSEDETYSRRPTRLPEIHTMDGNGSQEAGGLNSPVSSDEGSGTYVPGHHAANDGARAGAPGAATSRLSFEAGSDIELPLRHPARLSDSANGKQRTSYTPMTANGSHTPSVPRRSSKRNSASVDLTVPVTQKQHGSRRSDASSNSRRPFRSTSSQNSSIYDDADDEVAGHDRSRKASSALGMYTADVSDDRPTNVGYVSHNIRTVEAFEYLEFSGSQAELVDERGEAKSLHSGAD